ncbi:OmpA family protein [Dethiosulfatarculus sandiegensis]|uniref:OmpA-like domain-containing protein n=1 Tax=Dethiosulfatarculus sandiegensis TaxID=1429043 RepID=A0A0D2GJV9_9BACT|nr:OmpA family protein [Dethiosulfatarculus sandiegensis]KIX15017.1 hypothetical protein X474_05530 [Dethiosulfatarculus sandiegensis]
MEKGGKVVWEDRGQLVFTLPNQQGGTTWCRVTANSGLGQQYLNIVGGKPFRKSFAFGPAQMEEALDTDGRVRLYGILFDFDKATLVPESLKQLGYMIILLKENPDLNLEVQGHTDNKGSDNHNLELFQRRAETVVVFMGLFGVDSNRFIPKG